MENIENASIDYTRHYQNWHTDTPEHTKKVISFYKENILKEFSTNKESNILEIGCGMGFLLLALQESGYKNIKGIDVDKGQVAFCQKKGLMVDLVEDSIDYLQKNKDTFDTIVAFDVLEHIPPAFQIAFTKAIYEALKKEGVFLATVPNASSFLASRNRYIDYTHYVTFSEISLDFVLYNGGFKDIDIQEMDHIRFSFSPVRFLHWLLLKYVRLSRRITFIAELGFKQALKVPLSFNLMAKARK